MTGEMTFFERAFSGAPSDVTIEEAQIVFCDDHEKEIRTALIERGFGEDVAMPMDERMEQIRNGGMDTVTALHANLTIPAMHMFGLANLLSVKGCPVCAYRNIIGFAADMVAIEFARKN